MSNPLADPVAWSAAVREELLELGHRVTTFEQPSRDLDWRSTVECVGHFLRRRSEPVALVGWSQGAAIAQEVALAFPAAVKCAVLLATYGRQNEVDKVLQESWDRLARRGDDLDILRLAMGLLTAFPPELLADDSFVARMRTIQPDWAGAPDPQRRQQARTFIDSYQGRLQALTALTTPCLVLGFQLDTDTFAPGARGRRDTSGRRVPRARRRGPRGALQPPESHLASRGRLPSPPVPAAQR